MDIADAYAGHICVESVLYLADKFVLGAEVVSLSQRLEEVSEEKKAYAAQRLIKAMQIQKMIEDKLNAPLLPKLVKRRAHG
jgi:hypothetical protein